MAVVTWTSGAYTNHDAAELSQMGTWRGRAMDVAAVFPSRDNAAALTNAWYLGSSFSGGVSALAVAVPMCFTGGNLGQDLSSSMTTLANQYKADGRFFYIRLGWEMNLPQWPWAVTNANVAQWKSRFSQYANIFKSIMGAKCSIGLNPNIGANQSGYTGTMVNLLSASPYIEWAGPDAYDAFPPFTSDANVLTQHTTTQGLDFWTSFCQDNGIKLALPEYGVSSGTQWAGNCGNDNPRYITEMLANWLALTPDLIAFDCYFNEPASYVESDIFRKSGAGTANNPNSGVRYQTMFVGGTNSVIDASAVCTITSTATLTGGATTIQASAGYAVTSTASLSVTGDGIEFPHKALPVKVQIEVDNGWVDITSRVRSEDSIEIHRGTPDESSSPDPATMKLTLNNRDGLFSPRNPSSLYYGKIGRNTPIRCTVDSDGYAQITQETTTTVGTCSVSAPDTPATSVTGDIDIRFDTDLTSWRDLMTLYGKWTTTSNQRSYVFYLQADGTLSLSWSSTGTNVLSAVSTVPVPITTGRLAVRVTLDVNNGASGNTTTFYTSTDLEGSWTQLGDAVVTAGTTSIFNSTASSYLLDNPTDGFGNAVIHGRVYGAQVYSGIGGTLVANPDFTGLSFGATSFVDSKTNTWTVNSLLGSLEIRDFDIRFTGEVTEWPQAWDVSGNDVYVQIKCADIRRRLSQGAPPLASPIKHSILSTSNLRAYWPVEDSSSSTAPASGLVASNSMKVIGEPSFAADDTFLGSSAVAQFNGASVTGLVPAYTGVSNYSTTGAVQVRFLLHIPAAGAITGSQILRINHLSGGTIAYWILTYSTGGSLALQAKDGHDVDIAGAGFGPIAFAINGKNLYVSVELNNNAGPSITAKVATLEQGETTGVFWSQTVSSRSITKIASVKFNPNRELQDVGFGHVTVESAITSLFSVGTGPLSGYQDETAGIRIIRLSREQGVPCQSGGFTVGDTPMGIQRVNTYLNLIQECADADGGILYSPRDWLAIAYRPQDALMAQPADLTLDYEEHQLQMLQPIEDDQSTRNDVTVTRTGGSSSRAVDSTSLMSVNAPPDGIGTYADTVDLNLADDEQLADQASWRLRLGTIDEARYPEIGINLASTHMTDLFDEVAAVDIGYRLIVENPPLWVPPDDISQVVRGYTERMSQFEWSFDFNCTPSSPYDTAGVWGLSYKESRYSSDGSYLDGSYSSSATSFTVDTPVGPLWTEDAGEMPFDMIVAGERVTVTSIVTSVNTLQTFFVTRSINGVVKAQQPGAEIKLFEPSYYIP